MLKLKVIACDVLNREISLLSSLSSCFVDVTFLSRSLHDTPQKLNNAIKDAVSAANNGFPYNYFGSCPSYDYIILVYGLCSNAITGISSEKIPLIIPRAHDCITLLLGSKEQYREYFDKNPGTYWFSSGWVERGWHPDNQSLQNKFSSYTDKYGEENARYLIDTEIDFMKDYKTAAYIGWNKLGDSSIYRKYAEEYAKNFGLSFKELPGDHNLLARILNGTFNENEVLIVPPGKEIAPSYDNNIIKYK